MPIGGDLCLWGRSGGRDPARDGLKGKVRRLRVGRGRINAKGVGGWGWGGGGGGWGGWVVGGGGGGVVVRHLAELTKYLNEAHNAWV